MTTKWIHAALIAFLGLAITTEVHAYGGYHAGYTTVSGGYAHNYNTGYASGAYGSVSHTGTTTATPYGYQHAGTTTVNTANGRSYTTGNYEAGRAYSPTMYGGYSAAGATGAYGGAAVAREGYIYR